MPIKRAGSTESKAEPLGTATALQGQFKRDSVGSLSGFYWGRGTPIGLYVGGISPYIGVPHRYARGIPAGIAAVPLGS